MAIKYVDYSYDPLVTNYEDLASPLENVYLSYDIEDLISFLITEDNFFIRINEVDIIKPLADNSYESPIVYADYSVEEPLVPA